MSAAIDRKFEQTLAALINSGEPEIIQGGRKGVEKESLRVTPDGRIAQTPHPRALGSALTNEHITTDYSEALIELVSPTFRTSWELLQYLLDLHQFVYQHLGDELLWATSMPSIIDGDASIPIAQYGSSNVGRMKTVYREGLGLRYGRMMQAISGVHYNYSFPVSMWDAWADLVQSRVRGQQFISERYFHLLRNYRRHGWIVLYLFGVSPVVCNSFLRGRNVTLPRLSAGHLLRAVRDQPAHERPRLSQSQPGGPLGVGQQPRRIRARPVARHHHAARTLREVRCAGRTGSTASSTPTSCRSKTSTTASSVRNAWRAPASAPPRRCCAPVSNTWKCARST